ncbi:MAG: 16S rRNA (guanine(966)-N(2))-methyltransferase RsmD [Alphaproteobacteria bacterium]
MRIIGGKFKSTALANIGKGDEGAHLRPTTDRVRESLFNVLTHGNYPEIEGANVLDLFAGTGALGLEALSRGATSVQFVDDGNKANALIKQNIQTLNVRAQTKIYRRNATKLGENRSEPFNLIFLDPPYGKGLGEKAIAACIAGNWIAKDALIIWEENTPVSPPKGFTVQDARKYGDTTITILTYTT